MSTLYILTTSDLPNHVILGHASFAKKAGFKPVFIFPDRGYGGVYADYYREYSILNTRTTFSNKNLITYLFSILAFSIGVSKLLFFKKNVKQVLAVDLEGTLASIFLKIRGIKVYTLVNDNFAIRYNLNYFNFIIIRFIESLIYRLVSNLAIFPDQSRVNLLGYIKPKKIMILPNVLKNTVIGKYHGNPDDNLIVLVCGWLDKTRGLELIEQLLVHTNENIIFLLIGSGDMTVINHLTVSKRINFIGHVTREKTMELMLNVDINFAFYNPSITINRYAIPQKVSDSLSIGCPIFINSEVQMAESLFKSGSAYAARYWDILGIGSILNILASNKQELKKTSKRSLAYNENCVSFETVQNEGVEMYEKLLNIIPTNPNKSIE